jgi:multiple sugar transport system ATP-binding protein
VPTVYVTHDPVEALAAGDRVAVLQDARVVQVDTPSALYARPATVFVAAFVTPDPVGVLLARVVRSGGRAGLRVGERTLPLWAGLPVELEPYVDASVLLAFRPEDVHDAALVDDPNAARLRGVVAGTEFTGPSVTATVEFDAPPAVCPALGSWLAPAERATLAVRLPSDHPVQLAADLTLALDAARAHIFDPQTGAALWHPPVLDEDR